jgi:uncharacterized membrane protein YcaP (DUF421 family)
MRRTSGGHDDVADAEKEGPMEGWFGASWSTIGYVVASTTAIYCSALVATRLAGRRSLAQMSAFDVLVTVALGTLISSTAVSKDPSYLQGLVVLLTLLTLQVLLATLRQTFPRLARYVDFTPYVVLRHGEPDLTRSPFAAQMTREELVSKLRQQGVFDLRHGDFAILEPTGQISVVRSGTDLSSEGLRRFRLERLAVDGDGEQGETQG